MARITNNESRNPSCSEIQKVVVIGASAGGIDALTQLLSGLPADLPAAILVVQHLQPERETHLHEFLARHSSLQVCMAQDGMHPEAGVVYIARPGQHLRVENERLVLNKSEPVNYVRPSIDVLFTSAVHSRGSNVIGVILSGTGRDGTLGCRKIQAKGGVTIAQNERTSRYFTMPKTAIDAGAIDYVLPLQEIAVKIIALVEHGVTQKKEEEIWKK